MDRLNKSGNQNFRTPDLTGKKAGSTRLSQLFDVHGGAPGDSQVLLYQATSGKWAPVTLTATDVGAAEAAHNHDSEYYTKAETYTQAEADAAFAAIDHTHPDATDSTAGFMSATDKTNLDALVAGGTLNEFDTYLASSDTLGSTYADVTDLSITVDKTAKWMFFATAQYEFTGSYYSGSGDAQILKNGTAQGQTASVSFDYGSGMSGAITLLLSASNFWILDLTSGDIVKLQARASYSGTASIVNGGTKLSAFCLAT